MTDPELPRIGPMAAEDESPVRPRGRMSGLPMRAVLPNAITAAAMCSGLTGIRFAMSEQWGAAIFAVILAGVLDGIDGRIARLLKAQSRFGAELDSLADSLSFGTAPALILFLWSLDDLTRVGWFAALAFAICGALRLARFNAQIDVREQPHKSAGFLTGVPAPVGAGLVFLPFYFWMATGDAIFRDPLLVAPWTALVAFLMVSNLATLSWGRMRPRSDIRLGVIAVVGMVFAALLLEPWWTLAAICVVYLATMPWSIVRYARIRRQRAVAAAGSPDGAPTATN